MTFTLSEDEFNELLKRNPALSVNRPSKKQVDQRTEQRPQKKNKYRNFPVYIFKDGFVFNTADWADGKNSLKEKIAALITGHGAVSQNFDSVKEYYRYQELCLLEKAGTIQNLERQAVLIIQDGCNYQGEHLRPIRNCADFRYDENGVTVIEDVKGYDEKKKKWLTTQVFDLKWKLLKAKYPNYKFHLY